MNAKTTRLTERADGLWTVEHDLMMGGIMHFAARMTVVRLHDGSLWLHSPIPIDDALAAELAAAGRVRYLVAPNRLHHSFLEDAMVRYPEAQVWGAPGLDEKRRDLTFDRTLGDDPVAPWQPDLEQVHLAGNRWASEVVFLHRPSKTLLVTDLVFNIHRANNWFTRLVLRLVGAWQRVGQSKMWRLTTRDRLAAAPPVERMLGWDFERVIMAHGEIIERDGKAIITREVAWMRRQPQVGAGSVRSLG